MCRFHKKKLNKTKKISHKIRTKQTECYCFVAEVNDIFLSWEWNVWLFHIWKSLCLKWLSFGWKTFCEFVILRANITCCVRVIKLDVRLQQRQQHHHQQQQIKSISMCFSSFRLCVCVLLSLCVSTFDNYLYLFHAFTSGPFHVCHILFIHSFTV